MLLKQGVEMPTRGVDRWVEFGWWWTSTFISLSYCCNLIAVLTAPVFPEKLKSVQELAESPMR